jgi:hypothetical protein
MRAFRRYLAVGVLATLALPFATAATFSSGSEQGKPAARIYADAEAALVAAKNFHVLGNIAGQGSTEAFNLSMSRTGGGGSISVNGATINIVVASAYAYIKCNKASWIKLGATAADAALIANKWIKVPASDKDFSDFTELTLSKPFVSGLLSGPGTLTKVPGTSTFDGQKALVLSDGKGDKFYIASSGPPYLLHVQGAGSGSSGSMTFSDFGDAAMPSVPTDFIPLPSNS